MLKKKASESRFAVLSRQGSDNVLSRSMSSDTDSCYSSVDEGSAAKEADPVKVLITRDMRCSKS